MSASVETSNKITEQEIAAEAGQILRWHVEDMRMKVVIPDLGDVLAFRGEVLTVAADTNSLRRGQIRSQDLLWSLDKFSKVRIAPMMSALAFKIEEQWVAGLLRPAVLFRELPLPMGLEMAATHNTGGVSLRFIRGYDIRTDQFYSRFDVGIQFVPEQT